MAESADTKGPQPEALPQEIVRRLPEWRAEHGDLLYVAVSGGIIVRPITRGELIEFELNAAADPVWAQIALLRRILIHPSDWGALADEISLKDFQAVFKAIWDASGFRDPESFHEDLNDMRVRVMERDHAIVRHICAAFHSLNPDDVNRLNRSKILYFLAQAECILGVTFDGQDLAAIQEQLAASAQAAEHRDLGRRMAMGHNAPRAKRTFNVEQDHREANRFETDVSDINRPVQHDEHGRRI